MRIIQRIRVCPPKKKKKIDTYLDDIIITQFTGIFIAGEQLSDPQVAAAAYAIDTTARFSIKTKA